MTPAWRDVSGAVRGAPGYKWHYRTTICRSDRRFCNHPFTENIKHFKQSAMCECCQDGKWQPVFQHETLPYCHLSHSLVGIISWSVNSTRIIQGQRLCKYTTVLWDVAPNSSLDRRQCFTTN